MKTEKIGIVLTSWTEKEISGFLSNLKIGLDLGDLDEVLVKHEVEKYKSFTLNLETQEYETGSFCNIEVSKEIGRELKKIGFENAKLRFNGIIYGKLD